MKGIEINFQHYLLLYSDLLYYQRFKNDVIMLLNNLIKLQKKTIKTNLQYMKTENEKRKRNMLWHKNNT